MSYKREHRARFRRDGRINQLDGRIVVESDKPPQTTSPQVLARDPNGDSRQPSFGSAWVTQLTTLFQCDQEHVLDKSGIVDFGFTAEETQTDASHVGGVPGWKLLVGRRRLGGCVRVGVDDPHRVASESRARHIRSI